jgi:hypothetical protein
VRIGPNGDVAHSEPFGPASAFIVLDMLPPSPQKMAVILTFFELTFFLPRTLRAAYSLPSAPLSQWRFRLRIG